MIYEEKLHHGPMMLQPGCMYRISQDVEAEHLRGKLVVYQGFIKRWFDTTRAIVLTLKDEEEWWVKPSCLLPM